MKKIAVTGATGLVGSRIIELLTTDFSFISLNHADMDITDIESVARRFESLDADMVLHLAGYTNVDGAETDRDTAKKINVDGTRHLFEESHKKNIPFVYMSTDFVFDGTQPPYDENSVPSPLGYYGQTKFEGEQIIKDHAMIVRIAYPYRAAYDAKKDFMRTIRDLVKQGKTIAGITDSSFTPTFIDDVAFGLKHLMNNFSPEIYHLVGAQTLSPHDAFVAIARAFGLDQSLIQQTTFDEYFKGKAKRPQYSKVVSKKNNFYTMHGFEDGLKKCV